MGCGNSAENGKGVSKELRVEGWKAEEWRGRGREICAYNVIGTFFLTYVKKTCGYSNANGKLY